MTTEVTEILKGHLFGQEEISVFAVLDGASVPDLLQRLYEQQPEHECLYRGDLKPDLAEMAPYLVRLEPVSDFTSWVIGQGWGNHWGIFALSGADLRAMRQHFRRFLVVYDTNAKPMYFRYYDPRVLRVYLPTCNAEELATVFGPVTAYLVEDEAPNAMFRFRTAGGSLQHEKIPIELR